MGVIYKIIEATVTLIHTHSSVLLQDYTHSTSYKYKATLVPCTVQALLHGGRS